MSIIRYTTPTARFTFKEIDISDVVVAILSIKQEDRTVIERDIDSAVIINTESEQSISWKLTQEETKTLSKYKNVVIVCDWKLSDGTRGRSRVGVEGVEDTGKQEVI